MCGHIAAAHDDNIGFNTFISACPRPDPNALRTVRDSRLDIEILHVELLIRDDDVHVINTAKTMVCDREQTVRVRRKVNARDLGTFVCYDIEESWVLILPVQTRSG